MGGARGEHAAAVALAAGHVDDVAAGAAGGDPLVDRQVPAVPVVLLGDVGQRALAGQGERRHAVGLVVAACTPASGSRPRECTRVARAGDPGNRAYGPTDRLSRLMAAPATAERSTTSTSATTTSRPSTTTRSGASTTASSARARSPASSPRRSAARSATTGAASRSAPARATSASTSPLAGVDRRLHRHRHLTRDARRAVEDRGDARASRPPASAPRPPSCRSRTTRSTSSSATRSCTTCPTSTAPSPSSCACSGPAA